jgi:predicted nucleic acid-binding protein
MSGLWRKWLQEDLLIRFQDHLLQIDTDIMLLWGMMSAHLEKIGRQVSAIDGLLAATTLQHHNILVTRNTRHFEDTGILLLNPWES